MKKSLIKLMTTTVLAALTCTISSAQSLKDLLKKVTTNETVKSVVENVTGAVIPVDIKGTWTYSGTAVKLESDDILKSTAASLAATQIEEKLDTYVAKTGIKPGTFAFTFNEDKSFAATVKGKSFRGTYTISEDYKTLSLTFGTAISLKPFTAAISVTDAQLDLLFEADRLLELLGKLTASSSNSTLKAIGTIVNQYDGMKLGLELKK